MVSPRERSRQARRRIAGERSRPAGTRPAPEAPEAPTSPDAPPPPPEPADTAPAEERHAPAPVSDAESPARPEPPAATAAVPAEQPTEQPTEQPAEQATGQPGTAARQRRGADRGDGPPTWVLAVLAVLLVATLVLDGFLFWKQQRDQEAAERALHSAVTVAPSVAERAAEAVLSYRYNTVGKDIAEARRYLSAGYRPDYIASIRDVVAKPAQEIGAVVEAQVLASGVVEAGAERSDVLLFVNQTTTSAADTQSQTALNRVVFTMVPRGDTWKVDEIQAF